MMPDFYRVFSFIFAELIIYKMLKFGWFSIAESFQAIPQKIEINEFANIANLNTDRAGFYTTNPDLFPAIVEHSNTVKL